MINTDKKHFTHEELKKALKDFKTTKLDETDLKVHVIVLLLASIHPSTCTSPISHMYSWRQFFKIHTTWDLVEK